MIQARDKQAEFSYQLRVQPVEEGKEKDRIVEAVEVVEAVEAVEERKLFDN